MSRGSRIFLGGFLIFCALCFLAMAAALGPIMIAIALFCVVGAVACFSSGSHPVTVRIIGGTILAVCLVNLGTALRDPLAKPENKPRNGMPVIVYALAGFVFIGLPAGYAAATGRYPGWGQGAEAFHGKKKKSRKAKIGGDQFPRRF